MLEGDNAYLCEKCEEKVIIVIFAFLEEETLCLHMYFRMSMLVAAYKRSCIMLCEATATIVCCCCFFLKMQ